MENTHIAAPPKESSQKVEVPISKKSLATIFRCNRTDGKINQSRFYRLVLTPDVLAAAGLDEKTVRTPAFKYFTVEQSNALIRKLCLSIVPLLLFVHLGFSQTSATTAPSFRTICDTIPGVAVVTDSVLVMKAGPAPNTYYYAAVQTVVCLQARMVQTITTPTAPATQTFYRSDTWAALPPERVLLFRTLTTTK